MARRPDREKADILSEKDLKDLRHNLAHLSLGAVRDFYEQAYRDCRLILQPSTKPAADADTCPGLEAVAEMALSGHPPRPLFSPLCPRHFAAVSMSSQGSLVVDHSAKYRKFFSKEKVGILETACRGPARGRTNQISLVHWRA